MNKTNEHTLPQLTGKTGIFSDGDWVESKDQDPNGDVRLIQLADVGVGNFINKSARFMTSDKAKELKCTYLQKGDILIARMPDPIGRACIFPGDTKPCVTVVDICVLRPDPSIADTNYVVHMINSARFKSQLHNWVTGTTRQRISRGNLATLTFALPPLPEQRRIAAILDQADAIRRKRQKAIELTEKFLKSAFLEMFGDPVTNPKGWNVKELGQLDLFISDGNYSAKYPKASDFVPEGVPFIRANNLFRGTVVGEDLRFISHKQHGELKKGHIKTNDVLLTTRGDIGQSAIVPEEFDDANINAQLVLLRPKSSQLQSAYLHGLFQCDSMRRQLLRLQTGTALKQLPVGKLITVPIPIPNDNSQINFSNIFGKQQVMLRRLQKVSISAHLLFDSLVQRAFRGELSPVEVP